MYSQPNSSALRYICVEHGGNLHRALDKQLKHLIKVRDFTNPDLPCYFITITFGAGDNHFIFGAILKDRLLIIDPVGGEEKTKKNKVKDALDELTAPLRLKRIYYSVTEIQKEAKGKEGLVSCGPICLELMLHALQSPAIIQEFLDGIEREEKKGDVKAGDEDWDNITEVSIERLLPSSLAELPQANKSDYQERIIAVRKKHVSLLLSTSTPLSYEDSIIRSSVMRDSSEVGKKESVSVINKRNFLIEALRKLLNIQPLEESFTLGEDDIGIEGEWDDDVIRDTEASLVSDTRDADKESPKIETKTDEQPAIEAGNNILSAVTPPSSFSTPVATTISAPATAAISTSSILPPTTSPISSVSSSSTSSSSTASASTSTSSSSSSDSSLHKYQQILERKKELEKNLENSNKEIESANRKLGEMEKSLIDTDNQDEIEVNKKLKEDIIESITKWTEYKKKIILQLTGIKNAFENKLGIRLSSSSSNISTTFLTKGKQSPSLSGKLNVHGKFENKPKVKASKTAPKAPAKTSTPPKKPKLS